MKNFILFLGLAFIGLIAEAKPENDAGKKLTPFCSVVSDQGQPVTKVAQNAAINTAPGVAFNYIGNSFINYDRVYIAALKDESRHGCLKNYGFIMLLNSCKPPAIQTAQVRITNNNFKPDRQNTNYGYPLTADIR